VDRAASRLFVRPAAVNVTMQLRGARLCLDCEELHTEDRCPVCASDAFAFLTRWIPASERRARRRPPERPSAPAAPIGRLVKGGAVGIAAVALGRWLWRSTQPTPTVDSSHKGPGTDGS
jgi:hypothetical protein